MNRPENKTWRKYMSMEHLINLVICLTGIILVFVGIITPGFNNEVETILVSVGASLIASSIVAFLSSIYIQKYRRAKELSEIWGICSIEDKRTIMNIRIDAEMSKAKEHYDLIAYGVKSLREGNPQGVTNCLNRGVVIRILTVDPDCRMLAERDRQEGKKEGSTAHSIRQLREWAAELTQRYPGKILIRYSRSLPNEFYCRVDNYIYVGPYQYGKESQQMITTEYRNPGKGFLLYEDYFDRLWNDSAYCSELP